MTEDNSGQKTGGNVRFVKDGREAADGEFTHVMVRPGKWRRGQWSVQAYEARWM
jgi:hypothetical protein